MIAQLASNTSTPIELIKDPGWAMSQKLDGHRVLVHLGGKHEGNQDNRAFGRDGQWRNFPAHIMAHMVQSLPEGEWMFDGELVRTQSGHCYHIFDLITTPTHELKRRPWVIRDNAVQEICSTVFVGSNLIKSVASSTDPRTKAAMFKRFMQSKSEGVMFKRVVSPYTSGRSVTWRKFKFVTTVDCVVTDINKDGKLNLVLSVYQGSELIEIGKCSGVTGDGPKIKVGDVVEVTCLYSTEDARLYQPVSPKLRYDKPAIACLMSQVTEIVTNKSVLDLSALEAQ